MKEWECLLIDTGLGGWGRIIILVHSYFNFSIIPPAEHNFEHNTLVSRVTPKSIILYFLSVIRQLAFVHYVSIFSSILVRQKH